MWTFLGRIMVVALALLCLAPAEAQPGTLPLLDRRLATGVIYSEVADPARVQTDRAWESLRRSGATAYELAYPWDQLEGSDGDYDFGGLLALLDTLELAGMDTYLALTTIDTSVLRLPGRFLDPNDSGALRADLAFDSPEIVDALALLMLELAPELVERGCFYVSVGNEVDRYRVCRYTRLVGDPPAPSTRNVDHPNTYTNVTTALLDQNFLVIRAGDGTDSFACPGDDTSTPLVNGQTWLHQP